MCFCLWLWRTQSLDWTDTLGTTLPGCSYWDYEKFGILRILLKHKILSKVNSKLHANETRLIWTFFPLLISMILCMSIRTKTWYLAVTTAYKKFNCTFCYPWLLHDQLSRNLLTAPAAQGPSLAVTAVWVHFLITSYKIHPQRKKNNMYIVLQHRSDQAKHFNLPPWNRNKHFFPTKDKGSCFMRSLSWPNPLQEHWLNHYTWGESPCLCYMYEITNTKPRGETLHLQEIIKIRPTGSKGTEVALLNEAGTVLK